MKSFLTRNSSLWFSSVVTLLLLFSSCDEFSPTAPPPPAPPPNANRFGFIWGYVFSTSGECLRGAVVEVLDGAKAGARSTQIDCNFDDGLGYSFRDLPPDVMVRVRASREGYRSLETTIFATSGPAYPSNIALTPE